MLNKGLSIKKYRKKCRRCSNRKISEFWIYLIVYMDNDLIISKHAIVFCLIYYLNLFVRINNTTLKFITKLYKRFKILTNFYI